ncbi:MAG: hypothetical protein WA821_05120 [Anaerolineales bacterium]
MKYRFFLIIFSLSLVLAACSPADLRNALPFVVTTTNTPAPPVSRLVLSSPPAPANETPSLPEASPTLEVSATPAFTPTLTITVTPLPGASPTAPTPTDTLLPQLDIPTEKPNAPAFVAWTGIPTYAGDSEPGRLFRVDYDPGIWAQTTDNFGQVALAHRQIDYCAITAWSGRGLPGDAKVEHESRQLGNVLYDINTVSVGDVVKFVTYVGGDKRLLTGFQVSFQDQQAQCLLDAETMLATLRSFAAEPSITPTITLEPTGTPTPEP